MPRIVQTEIMTGVALDDLDSRYRGYRLTPRLKDMEAAAAVIICHLPWATHPCAEDTTIGISAWSDEIQRDMFDPIALVLSWVGQSPATRNVRLGQKVSHFHPHPPFPSNSHIYSPALTTLSYTSLHISIPTTGREMSPKCENGKFYYTDPIDFSVT
jgi:hypothetical protein